MLINPQVYPIVYSNEDFCLKLKISLDNVPIWFYILGKLHIDPMVVYAILFKPWVGLKLFFWLHARTITEPLDARGVVDSYALQNNISSIVKSPNSWKKAQNNDFTYLNVWVSSGIKGKVDAI